MAIMYSEDIGFLSSYPKSEFDKTYHLHKYVSQDNRPEIIISSTFNHCIIVPIRRLL